MRTKLRAASELATSVQSQIVALKAELEQLRTSIAENMPVDGNGSLRAEVTAMKSDIEELSQRQVSASSSSSEAPTFAVLQQLGWNTPGDTLIQRAATVLEQSHVSKDCYYSLAPMGKRSANGSISGSSVQVVFASGVAFLVA